MYSTYEIAAGTIALLAAAAELIYLTVSWATCRRSSTNDDRMTLLNTYPGELGNAKGSKRILPLVAGLAAALLGMAATALIFGGDIPVPSVPDSADRISVYPLFVMLFAAASSLGLGLATVLPLSNVKGSLICWMVGILFTAGWGILSIGVTTGDLSLVGMNLIPRYVACGLSVLLLASLLNPKVKNWSRMERTEVDGATYFLRPKVNWMSVNIWSAHLVAGLNLLLITIAIFVGNPQ